MFSRYAASTSCCSERKTGCGSPHPPHRNAGVSDLPMPVATAIGSRTSLGLSLDTPTRLGRNALRTPTADTILISQHLRDADVEPRHIDNNGELQANLGEAADDGQALWRRHNAMSCNVHRIIFNLTRAPIRLRRNVTMPSPTRSVRQWIEISAMANAFAPIPSSRQERSQIPSTHQHALSQDADA